MTRRNTITRKKLKSLIVDIVIPEEKLQELNYEAGRRSTNSRPAIIRKYAGGTCVYCGDIPKKKLLFDVGDGGKLVEFYCDKCFERWVRRAEAKKDHEKSNKIDNLN